MEHQPGRIAAVPVPEGYPLLFQRLHRRPEPGVLPLGKGGVRVAVQISGGEVGENSLRHKPRQPDGGRRLRCRRGHMLHPPAVKAQPAHAAVYLHMHLDLHPGLAGGAADSRLAYAVEKRVWEMSSPASRSASSGWGVPQNQDGADNAPPPQLDTLLQIGNGEGVGPHVLIEAGQHPGPVAAGIRLDHRHHPAVPRLFFYLGKIMPGRVQIHFGQVRFIKFGNLFHLL